MEGTGSVAAAATFAVGLSEFSWAEAKAIRLRVVRSGFFTVDSPLAAAAQVAPVRHASSVG